VESDVLMQTTERRQDIRLLADEVKLLSSRLGRYRDLTKHGYSLKDLGCENLLMLAGDAITCSRWAVEVLDEMDEHIRKLAHNLGGKTRREHWF